MPESSQFISDSACSLGLYIQPKTKNLVNSFCTSFLRHNLISTYRANILIQVLNILHHDNYIFSDLHLAFLIYTQSDTAKTIFHPVTFVISVHSPSSHTNRKCLPSRPCHHSTEHFSSKIKTFSLSYASLHSVDCEKQHPSQ